MRCLPADAVAEPASDPLPDLADAFYGPDVAARIGGRLGARPAVGAPSAAGPSLAALLAQADAQFGLPFARAGAGEESEGEEEEDDGEDAPLVATRLPWAAPVDLAVYLRLAGGAAPDHDMMKEFRKNHARLLYSRHVDVSPRDMVPLMELFFDQYRGVQYKKGADTDVRGIHTIWFWLMCAHFAAACFLPYDARPWPGAPDSVNFADFIEF